MEERETQEVVDSDDDDESKSAPCSCHWSFGYVRSCVNFSVVVFCVLVCVTLALPFVICCLQCVLGCALFWEYISALVTHGLGSVTLSVSVYGL